MSNITYLTSPDCNPRKMEAEASLREERALAKAKLANIQEGLRLADEANNKALKWLAIAGISFSIAGIAGLYIVANVS